MLISIFIEGLFLTEKKNPASTFIPLNNKPNIVAGRKKSVSQSVLHFSKFFDCTQFFQQLPTQIFLTVKLISMMVEELSYNQKKQQHHKKNFLT